MDAAMIIGFSSILAALVVDYVLARTWNRAYFTFGIPVFMRRIVKPDGLAGVSLEALESHSKTAAGAPLLFHRLAPDRIAFRDQWFTGTVHYLPILHGVIHHDVHEGAVRVKALLNLFPIVFVTSYIAMLGVRHTLDLAPLVLGVFAVIYFIQAVRYNRVAKQLDKLQE